MDSPYGHTKHSKRESTKLKVMAQEEVVVNFSQTEELQDGSDTPKVLLVDTSIPLCLSIREILMNSGFSIIGRAENTQQAIQLAKMYKPDLVILSATLKGDNGLAVLNQLRDIIPDLKAILLTSDSSDVVSAAQNGEHCVLAKPINSLRLVELARSLTGS